jgi:hypothetical protein
MGWGSTGGGGVGTGVGSPEAGRAAAELRDRHPPGGGGGPRRRRPGCLAGLPYGLATLATLLFLLWLAGELLR